MPDKDDEYPTREKGWMFSLTLPRVLSLRQGHIYSRPARELKALRIEETAIDLDMDMEQDLTQQLFDGTEVLLDITLGKAQHLSLTLAYGLEKTVFSYDRTTQVMTIDRTGMKHGGRGVRRFKLFVDRVLSLQLFIDRVAIEAFFQHGEEVASLLVFPEKNIRPELRIHADASLESVAGRLWELDVFHFHP